MTPEFGLSEEEGTAIVTAATAVADEYGFAPSGKAQAWTNLALVAGGIAGAHYWMYKARTAQHINLA
jgi:hypothetical protein